MNKALRDELEAMLTADQETRTRLLRAGALYGDYAAEMQQVHTRNAERLSELIDRFGWPHAGLVGDAGARAAWMIAQHSICTPDLQRRFLEVLVHAASVGRAPARQMAMLTDRIRFHEGRPQCYGCVLDWNDRGQLSCEVEAPERLDQRRASVGLKPFAEELRAQREAVAAEGGRPPADLVDYRCRQSAWARQVGWRP